jgi:manganese transport protein
LITGVITYLILLLEHYGFRPLEAVITSLVGVIVLCYLIEMIFSRPAWQQIAAHAIVPWEGNTSSVLFSVGIVGATIMPHAIYLHSSLTQQRIIPRSEHEARRIFRWSIPDSIIAMGLAGLVNMAILCMAAATFFTHGRSNVADLNTAYQTLTPLLGEAASLVFGIALLASGLSSSTVGTMAGQVIMQGFVGFTIPIWIRRLVTMLPAIVVVLLGINATQALVMSQVVLSFVLPMPVITLLLFTRRCDVMGILVNKRSTTILASICGAAIIALDTILIYLTFAPLFGWWSPN